MAEGMLMQSLIRFNDFALRIGRTLAWILIGIMTAIVLYQVFFRYVLNDAPSWSEAGARALMVWMTFLVAPTAYRWGAYVSIDTLVHALTHRLRHSLSLILNVVALVLIVVMFWLSIDFVDRGFTRSAAGLPREVLGLPLKAAWIRLAMPVGLFLMITVAIELILKDALYLARGERAKEEEEEKRPDFMLFD